MSGYDEMSEFDGGMLTEVCDQCDAYAILDANHFGKGQHRWRIMHDPACPVWLNHLGRL